MLKAPGSKEASANVSKEDDAGTEKQRESASVPDEGGNDCSEPHSVMQFEGQ